MFIRYLDKNDNMFEISGIYEKSWKYTYKDIIPQDWLDSIPEGRWVNIGSREGLNSLVVIEEDRIIGTSAFCASRWNAYKDFGEIVSIYLLPEYIGKGYGKPLLKRCISELRAKGFVSILLWVLEENNVARRFYEKNGFICTGEYMEDNIGGRELREVLYTCNTVTKEADCQ